MRKTLLLAACLIAPNATLGGALCLPRDSKAEVVLNDQQGIVFYREGRQCIVIRVGYELRRAAEPVTKLGWIIPVPDDPDALETADAMVFDELAAFTKPVRKGEAATARTVRQAPGEQPAAEPTITRLGLAGKGGVGAADDWLEKHGLQPIPPEAFSCYDRRPWHFVAVLFENPDGLPVRGNLSPIRISSPSLKIRYPLKLFAGPGAFDFTLYIFCKGRINRKEVARFGLTMTEVAGDELRQANRTPRARELPQATRELFAAATTDPQLDKLGRGRIFLYRLFAPDLNNEDDPIADWETDLAFSEPLGSPYSIYINIAVGLLAVIAVFALARPKQDKSAADAEDEGGPGDDPPSES